MKQYAVYFHDMLEEYNDLEYDKKLDDYVESDSVILAPDNYDRILDKDLWIRYTEEHRRSSNKDDPARELHFECYLIYEAEDDTDAIANAKQVLEKHDFDWVSVYVIVEMNMIVRKIAERGMTDYSDRN